MEAKFPHLCESLRMRDTIFPNRIFCSAMGCPPSHKHPSSPKYDAGVGFYDKSAGGAAGIVVSVCQAQENATYPKYERDQIRELMSLARQTGAIAALDFSRALTISAGAAWVTFLLFLALALRGAKKTSGKSRARVV